MGPHKRHGPGFCGLCHKLWQRVHLVLDLRLWFAVLLGEETRTEARGRDCTRGLDNTCWLDAETSFFKSVGINRTGPDEGWVGGATEGKVKVREHYMAVFPHEDVFGFEVTVDDAEHVEVLHRQ